MANVSFADVDEEKVVLTVQVITCVHFVMFLRYLYELLDVV